MGELDFLFQEMFRELSDFGQMAVGFLDPSAEASLGQLRAMLEHVQTSAPSTGTGVPWGIPDYNPLLTRPCRAYERGRKRGGPEICARITSIWEVRPGPRSRKKLPETFRVVGKASVRVEWLRVEDGEHIEPLGMWRMELADGASPGCFFHVQIQGEDGRHAPPFPHAVPVPRLPCIAFTPMAVLEFVLGEQFQDQWEDHSMVNNPASDSWRGSQQRRLIRLLDWQRGIINGSRSCPPWTALKQGRPDSNLFLG